METKKPFPYSKETLSMPKGAERTAAQARERSKAYSLRKKGTAIKNTTIKNDKHNLKDYINDKTLSIPDNITFKDPINLIPFINKVKIMYPTITNRTIYGEACELVAEKYLPCKQCNNRSWIKAKKNQAAFDLECAVCETRYQIKGAKHSYIKPVKGTCEILCGRFPGVFECHTSTKGLDYYLFENEDKI